MAEEQSKYFVVGCIHLNEEGYYVIESVHGDKLKCRHLNNGKISILSCRIQTKIELRLLGYILRNPSVSREILDKHGIDISDWSDIKIVEEAGKLLEEKRKMEVQQSVQKLYEDQLRRSGKPSASIRVSTNRRESGCHKCKKSPLISEALFECPLCFGMVCCVCGSCFCNRK